MQCRNRNCFTIIFIRGTFSAIVVLTKALPWRVGQVLFAFERSSSYYAETFRPSQNMFKRTRAFPSRVVLHCLKTIAVLGQPVPPYYQKTGDTRTVEYDTS